jgi:hypothetical protein
MFETIKGITDMMAAVNVSFDIDTVGGCRLTLSNPR